MQITSRLIKNVAERRTALAFPFDFSQAFMHGALRRQRGGGRGHPLRIYATVSARCVCVMLWQAPGTHTNWLTKPTDSDFVLQRGFARAADMSVGSPGLSETTCAENRC
jgi:hypothetical protein